MTGKKLLLTAVMTLGVWGTANAGTVNLTYADTSISDGANANYGVSSITGSGVVTFADSLTDVSLGDVTSFSFALTVAGTMGTDIDVYGLGDLSSFSASLDSSGNVVSASFVTSQDSSGDYYYPSQGLSMDTASSGGSSTGNFDVGVFSVGDLTAAATTSVPEPASMALLGAGIVGLGLRGRKRA